MPCDPAGAVKIRADGEIRLRLPVFLPSAVIQWKKYPERKEGKTMTKKLFWMAIGKFLAGGPGAGLPGYGEYRKKVRWRLIPGIW